MLLRADRSIPVGVQRSIEELALDLGFSVAVLGAELGEQEALEPESPAEPEPGTGTEPENAEG